MDNNYKTLIDEEFSQLKTASLKRCASQEEFDLVLKAFEFVNDAYKDQIGKDSRPIILHSIELAKIVVSEISLGYKSIITALLHDLPENSEFTIDDIQLIFGDKIASMVEGLQSLNKIFADNKDTLNENFRNMLITISDDVRIIIIKLADVLLVMRNIELIPEKNQAKIVSEAMYVFVPLAHRLGLYSIKTEMENCWMKFALPNEYNEIQEKLNQSMAKREDSIQRLFIDPIVQSLRQSGHHFNIQSRTKSPYSIWRKIQKRGVTFEEIYDIFAIRIIFYSKDEESENRECLEIESILNSMFQPNPNRRRDWLTQPKDTGYQALHSTYLSPLGNWIEVQIRSKRMDDLAERGLAAHWKYKEKDSNSAQNPMELWISKVRAALENKDVDALDFFDKFHTAALTPEIYIFTPKGEPRPMPKGSTVLDLAYNIHSAIGAKALAAKVNQRLEPLNYELKSGEQVEIITADSQSPKIEWLNFVKTSKARMYISDAVKEEAKKYAEKGEAILKERLNSLSIQLKAKVIKKLLPAYKVLSKEELYIGIGYGNIDLGGIEDILKSNKGTKIVRYWKLKVGDSTTTDFQTASCCKVYPPKDIVCVKRGNSYIVHSASCKELKSSSEEYLKAQWERFHVKSYLMKIHITGLDRKGIIKDIASVLSNNYMINTRNFHFYLHDGIFETDAEFYIQNTCELPNIIEILKKVPGIQTIKDNN